MNFAWRKWKLGVAVSVVLALLVAGSGVAAGMHWQAFVSVLCMALLTHLGAFLKDHPVDAVTFDDDKQNDSMKKLLSIGALLTVAGVIAGCGALNPVTKTETVTNGATNFSYTVNSTVLDAECAGLGLVGTPLVTDLLANEPAARPIITDVQTAINAALNGSDTNVVATIDGLISKNATVQKQMSPLVKGADTLRAQLLAKYGSTVAGQIATSILNEDLAIVTAALNATK